MIVVYAFHTLESLVADAAAPQRLRAAVLVAIAGLALLLAVVGLYGLVAYAMATRTAEIGVRIALGATSRNVTRMVLREGLTLVSAGAAFGIPSAIAVSRLASGLLYGIGPTDLASYGGATGLLVLMTLAACYVPARRAAGIDPVAALRSE